MKLRSADAIAQPTQPRLAPTKPIELQGYLDKSSPLEIATPALSRIFVGLATPAPKANLHSIVNVPSLKNTSSEQLAADGQALDLQSLPDDLSLDMQSYSESDQLNNQLASSSCVATSLPVRQDAPTHKTLPMYHADAPSAVFAHIQPRLSTNQGFESSKGPTMVTAQQLENTQPSKHAPTRARALADEMKKTQRHQTYDHIMNGPIPKKSRTHTANSLHNVATARANANERVLHISQSMVAELVQTTTDLRTQLDQQTQRANGLEQTLEQTHRTALNILREMFNQIR